MGRKKLFSLIEISVAMAVAAFGVAAIMALLPIAVKSTADSVGDTLAIDVASAAIAQLDRAAWDHFEWLQSLPTSKSNPFSDDEARNYAKMELQSDSYRVEPETGLQNGHFVFLFGPPNKSADFAAEVICWKEADTSLSLTTFKTSNNKVNVSSVKMNTIKYPSGSSSASGKESKAPYVRVFIEVTWPLTKPYSVSSNKTYPRQTRLFVREYLDPAYYKPVN